MRGQRGLYASLAGKIGYWDYRGLDTKALPEPVWVGRARFWWGELPPHAALHRTWSFRAYLFKMGKVNGPACHYFRLCPRWSLHKLLWVWVGGVVTEKQWDQKVVVFMPETSSDYVFSWELESYFGIFGSGSKEKKSQKPSRIFHQVKRKGNKQKG